MEPLAGPAIEAVRSGERRNLYRTGSAKFIIIGWKISGDWCISRQLWWTIGSRPGTVRTAARLLWRRRNPHTCPKCGGCHLEQDPDTLDTWFSSALWPFPRWDGRSRRKELKYFYPTSTLVTGYDIIFFWVARMIFSGVENTGKSPFQTVFIHGIVRDAQGRKKCPNPWATALIHKGHR